jgi:cytochrome c oxidase subunit 2
MIISGLALLMFSVVAQNAPGTAARKPDRTIRIVAERFSFSPSKLRLKQGSDVELVLSSEDTSHGFRISAAGIDSAIPQQGKGELRVRFLARQKGKYVFECSRPCGAGHNMMRGLIIVE